MEQTKQYEYVDLGLPSGLKWAKCNVGATSETDYGDYFQWGSTRPNTADECTRESYKFYNSAKYSLTKYCVTSLYGLFGIVDNKTTLDLEDDAARANMGGDWRMPTEAEFQELLDNTDNEWIEDFNGSGVNGRKFTSKTNGNSIFIPASGHRIDNSVYDGSYGDVWSSSPYTSYSYSAWGLYFYPSNCCMSNYYRHFGLPVRGVMD